MATNPRDPKHQGRPRLAVVITAIIAAIALLAVAVYYVVAARDRISESRGPATGGAVQLGGPFALRDQTGRQRTDDEFRGQLMLIFFGYTYCPDVCPTSLQTMSDVLDSLGAKADRVQPIFITVDPERDTVAQLKDYTAHFHPRLLALTGTAAEIASVAKAYRVYYRKAEPAEADENSDDYLVDHTSIMYLMDRDGAYLHLFRHDAPASDIAAEIERRL